MSGSFRRVRRGRGRRTGVSRVAALFVLLASLLAQPAWGVAPRRAPGTDGEGCCCSPAAPAPPAAAESSGCCGTRGSDGVPAPAGAHCGCRARPADERPLPAPVAADLTRELIRRHHLAAELSSRAPGFPGVARAPGSDGSGGALASHRAHDPPGARTAPTRSLGERGVARLLAFLSVARI